MKIFLFGNQNDPKEAVMYIEAEQIEKLLIIVFIIPTTKLCETNISVF